MGSPMPSGLGARLSAKVTSHPKFGTAVLTLPAASSGRATARTEYYEYPAGAPHGQHSSIKMDLYRRTSR